MLTEVCRVRVRKVAFVFVPALLLTIVALLESEIIAGSVWYPGLTFATVSVLGWLLTSWLDATTPSEEGRVQATLRTGSKKNAVLLAAIAVVGWLLMYSLYGPFASMNDTVHIVNSPFGGARQHPLMYNLVMSAIIQGCAWLSGSWAVGAVVASLLQIGLYFVALAWTLYTLDRLGVGAWWRVALAVSVGAMAVIANYSFALVKDATFSAFVYMLIPVILTIHTTRGRILTEKTSAWTAGLTACGFAVTRNNALAIVVLVAIIAIVLAHDARKRACLVFGIAVVAAFIPQTATTMFAGQQKFVEAAGVPLQMVGSTLVNSPECVPPESAQYFERVYPAQQWEKTFNPVSVDPVKFNGAFDAEYLQETKGEFLGHTVGTLKACPEPMLRGYAMHSSPLWKLQGQSVGETSQSAFLSPISNFPADRKELIASLDSLGVKQWGTASAPGGKELDSYYRWTLNHTPSTGFWIWVAVLLVAAFAYAKRFEGLAVLGPSLLLWGTLMAAAPVGIPFRYVAFLPWVLLVASVVLLGTRKRRRS